MVTSPTSPSPMCASRTASSRSSIACCSPAPDRPRAAVPLGRPSPFANRVSTVHIRPLTVRITHWTNAVAMTVMIASSLQIYTASSLFRFASPTWLTLAHWLIGALDWHVGAIWLLVENF